MVRRFYIFFAVSIVIAFSAMSFFVHAATDAGTIDVNVAVMGCNNNSMCEPLLGENNLTCLADCPAPVSPGNPSGGGATSGGATGDPISILSFSSQIDITTAAFFWTTNVSTVAMVSWGETLDFEKGSQTMPSFVKDHKVYLSELKPNTLYYYKIYQRTAEGREHTFIQQFVTLPYRDITAPENIWDITVTPKPDKGNIEIIWHNPPDLDFKEVVLVRSPQFFPRDPHEGKIVYQGSGSYVVDYDFRADRDYYYTIFTFDDNGNYSSGTVFFVPRKGSTPTTPQKPTGPIPEYPGYELTLNDFIFSQNNKNVAIASTTISLEMETSFKVSLPHGILPDGEHIVLFSALDPNTKKDYSFMLKRASSTSPYESTLFFKAEEGTYPLTISIYDTDHKLVKIIDGFLEFHQSDLMSKSMISRLSKMFSFWVGIALILTAFCIVFLWIAKLFRVV